MKWTDTLFRRWGFTRRPAATAKPRGFRPAMESLETREVPAVLQGYAFVDNGNNVFDAGDTAKQGATIRLLDNTGAQVASTTTNSAGFYQFANVTAGQTYTLVEAASGYTAVGAQANTAFSGATVNGDKSIQVTIPGEVSVHRLFQDTAGLPGVNSAYTLNDGVGGPTEGPANWSTRTPSTFNAHQYELELTSSAHPAAQTVFSFCVDLFHENPKDYTVAPSSTPNSPAPTYNLDMIGYLYNKYGTQQLDATHGTGLALAMYELLYDPNPSLDAGSFMLQAGTDPAARTAAEGYIAEAVAAKAAGKTGPMATFLNVTDAGNGSQGMLATETYNFLNKVAENPAISLTKKADCTVYKPGDIATYTYVVTNTGNVTLTNVKIVDDNATPGNTGDDFIVKEGVTLAAGQSMTFTRKVKLPTTMTTSSTGGMGGKCSPQPPSGEMVLTNKAVVTGTSPSGKTVTASATATVTVRATTTCDNGSHGKGSHGKGSHGKCDNGSHGKGSHGKCDNGSNGKGSHGKGSHSKGSHGKCDNGSHGKGSHGKGSSGKCDSGHGSNGKGSHSKGSSGKGSHSVCDNGSHGKGSSGKGSYGKGSHGKGSSGKGSYDRCEPIKVCVPVVKVCAPPVKVPSRGKC